MPEKVSISEEIKALAESLDTQEDTHPDYISSELKNLQAKVLSVHAHLENALETRIFLRIKKDISPASDETWRKITSALRLLVEALSYGDKVEIVEGYADGAPALFRLLRKVNKYRVEFAHPKGMKLRSRYDFGTSQGKVNVRDVLRCLVQAKREMDNYFIKVEGVPKLREKVSAG